MAGPKTSLRDLNLADRDAFVAVVGPVFEHSPWIAARAWEQRPFVGLAPLHQALCQTVQAATLEEKLALIRVHPDLVGQAARAGTLTSESSREQAAAGLGELGPEEIAVFDGFNRQYRQQFGFPFVICARQNKKDAILAAFPVRLAHTREEEIAVALHEIAKIAWLRLADAVSEE